MISGSQGTLNGLSKPKAPKPTTPRSTTPRPIFLTEVWRRYKKTGEREARNQLVLAYSPIVKYVAGRIAARAAAHLARPGGQEVRHVEAGAAAQDARHAPRERQSLDQLRLGLVAPAGHPHEVPLCEGGGDLAGAFVPVAQRRVEWLGAGPYQRHAAARAEARAVALDELRHIGRIDGLQTTLVQTLPDDSAVDPAASADATDLRERIAEAIEHLPEREQLVLGLRYHQELRLAEIGQVLGVSESRISQLHAKAVLHLRALLPDGQVVVTSTLVHPGPLGG